MTVLRLHKRLLAEESCRHVYIPFNLPSDNKELCVRFEFAPSQLDDRQKALALIRQGMAIYEPNKEYDDEALEEFLPLKNMLTLSIDSPQGTVGTAHRFAPKQKHTISAQKSSRGFLPQTVTKGQWTVTVSAFHFVTPYVDFELEVSVE